MICPRCGNEWDASKSPCTRCGLVIRLPNQPGSTVRTSPQNTADPFSSGKFPTVRPQGSDAASSAFSRTAFPVQPSTPRGSMPGSGPAQPISSPQVPNTPRPAPFPAAPVPKTQSAPSAMNTPPGLENSILSRLPRNEPGAENATHVPGSLYAETLSPRSVPQRAVTSPQNGRYTDSLAHEMPRPQSPLRASRLVTDQLNKEAQRAQAQQQSDVQAQPEGNNAVARINLLPPGTLLRNERYRLQELQGGQEWLSGVYEAVWLAQDAQRNGAQVIMSELMLPATNPVMVQSTLRNATIALTSAGRHPRIPTLWDAFSDRGRSFFVFEPIEGESLLYHMHRLGRVLQEQDVIECCLQMTEVLELLSQQSPPLVHGFIRPEHIMISRFGSQYMLTNFSLVLAGGATQYVTGIDRTRLSAYTSPEFVRGAIDVRSDLYSLIATAYYVVTGSLPVPVNGTVPPAQRLNPNASAQFDAILSRGLHALAGQRYQRPSELRQELLLMRSVSSTLVPGGRPVQPPQPAPAPAAQPVADSVAQTFKSLAVTDDFEERKLLLPAPEELPPLKASNDTLNAAIWLTLLLISVVIIVVLTRGF